MKRVAIVLLSCLGTVLLGACAAAYRDYPCGVHYRFCGERPLPYRTYCGCPTPVAKEYRQQAAEQERVPEMR